MLEYFHVYVVVDERERVIQGLGGETEDIPAKLGSKAKLKGLISRILKQKAKAKAVFEEAQEMTTQLIILREPLHAGYLHKS